MWSGSCPKPPGSCRRKSETQYWGLGLAATRPRSHVYPGTRGQLRPPHPSSKLPQLPKWRPSFHFPLTGSPQLYLARPGYCAHQHDGSSQAPGNPGLPPCKPELGAQLLRPPCPAFLHGCGLAWSSLRANWCICGFPFVCNSDTRCSSSSHVEDPPLPRLGLEEAPSVPFSYAVQLSASAVSSVLCACSLPALIHLIGSERVCRGLLPTRAVLCSFIIPLCALIFLQVAWPKCNRSPNFPILLNRMAR